MLRRNEKTAGGGRFRESWANSGRLMAMKTHRVSETRDPAFARARALRNAFRHITFDSVKWTNELAREHIATIHPPYLTDFASAILFADLFTMWYIDKHRKLTTRLCLARARTRAQVRDDSFQFQKWINAPSARTFRPSLSRRNDLIS